MNAINKKIGILGGGQLGRMFIQEAINLNVSVSILDPNPDCPCALICNEFYLGNFNDYQTVLDFGRKVDVLTIEIEHVNVVALYQLQKEGIEVYPQPQIIELIQDKGFQKEFYIKHNIPTASFKLFDTLDSADQITFPFIAKSRRGGYDGKGVALINSKEDFHHSILKEPFLTEEKIPFTKELSVIIARNKKGEIQVYSMVEQEFNQKANLVELLFSPAKVTIEVERNGGEIAKNIITKLDMVGILAVEFFLTSDNQLLVNEIAPRPHNSGHHTIEANSCSQFEQHLRSILNLPLGETITKNAGVMINLLGEPNAEGFAYYDGLEDVLKEENTFVHLYGKSHTKAYRKMGHITVVDDDLDKAIEKAKKIKNKVKVISKAIKV